jgi:hypothetical protein
MAVNFTDTKWQKAYIDQEKYKDYPLKSLIESTENTRKTAKESE